MKRHSQKVNTTCHRNEQTSIQVKERNAQTVTKRLTQTHTGLQAAIVDRKHSTPDD